jgi:hypothetical protein
MEKIREKVGILLLTRRRIINSFNQLRAELRHRTPGVKLWRKLGTYIFALNAAVSACVVHGEDIEFANRVVSFTNLQGEAFRDVQLIRGDLDGVVWRAGVSGGRVSYTNLDGLLLGAWGISSNRVGVARSRAEQKAALAAQERAAAIARARTQALTKAKAEAEWAAGAPARELRAQKEAEVEAITTLQSQIENARLQLRRATALAHDHNAANARNKAVPRIYIKDTERVKIQEEETRLKKMKASFSLKYGSRLVPEAKQPVQ